MGDAGSDEARHRLKRTFDTVAERYDHARPSYPRALLDRLVAASAIRAGDHLLEIGCGTGIATRPLAARGFDITCVELGPELAAVATRNLADLEDVRVVNAAFETWTPPTEERFALVFAATAWHWLDPDVRYRRAFELLRPGGHLAFWAAMHVFPDDGDPFLREIQDVYEEIGEGMAPDAVWSRPGEQPDERADIEGSGLFDVVTIDHFDWETVHDADSYLALLDTFSSHIAMAPWQRERLYDEIRRRLAARPDGRLRRHWGAVLHVARRRG